MSTLREDAQPEEDSPGVFSLPGEAVDVYARLLESAPATLADLLTHSDDPARARSWLDRFAELGLVWRDSADLVHVSPPRAAAEAWAVERELEAARARESAQVLADMYATQRRLASGPVEVIEGGEATLRVFQTLVGSARDEILGLDRGPYLTSGRAERDDLQLAALRRGVRYRVIYEASVLADAHNMRVLRMSVAAGEQARVFPDVPMKLLIFDGKQAFLPVYRPDRSAIDALLLHPSPLLDVLSEVYEAFWRLSAPIHTTTGSDTNGDASAVSVEPTPETQHLLALLTAGLTDESIARMLGVSERTVSRRVGRLQELLGARTRFQLGVQASRRNWT